MKSISGKKLAKILEKKGWILVKTRGTHFKYEKGQDSLVVPIHGNKDLPIGTLKSIVKDGNLTENGIYDCSYLLNCGIFQELQNKKSSTKMGR